MQLQVYLYLSCSLPCKAAARFAVGPRMDLRLHNEPAILYPTKHPMLTTLTMATAWVIRALSSPGSTSDMGPLRKARGPSSIPTLERAL